MVALERAGVKVDKYYSSEVDRYAIAVSEKNYKEITRLGDVTKWKDWDIDWSSIDLLIGGSPCQGFSLAGKQLNFKDERSKLFFEYVEILEHIKEQNPKMLFLLENVRMKKEYRDVITRFLKVEPILINSSLVSAQDRKRLYWTNIKGVEQPQDRGILLKDIVHEYKDFKYMLTDSQNEWLKKNGQFQLDKAYSSIDSEKAITMTARQYASWNGNFKFEELYRYIVPFDKTLKILEKEVEKGKVGYLGLIAKVIVYITYTKRVWLCVVKRVEKVQKRDCTCLAV